MQMIIWAFSSMLILLLIISFLPLGFTLKGKFFVVLAGFVLALGGLAAVSSFPLWQTASMLVVLVFFSAYFMNNRLGELIYNDIPTFDDTLDEDYESPSTNYQVANVNDANLLDINEEMELPETSFLNIEKDQKSVFIPEIKKALDIESEIIDEDISFLLERGTEDEINEQIEESTLEKGYLSDIEDLLVVESEEQIEALDEDILEEIYDLTPIVIEKETLPENIDNDDEEQPLDDTLFDFLLTNKEVAADRDDTFEEIDTKKKISLQK